MHDLPIPGNLLGGCIRQQLPVIKDVGGGGEGDARPPERDEQVNAQYSPDMGAGGSGT